MLADEISIPAGKIKYGLSRTLDFLKLCNNPENDFFSIQILGTNGKGTVAALLSEILIDAGYNVGTYSSPHLVEINERIKVNNTYISDKEIHCFLNTFHLKAKKIQPSFFELMTVMGMWYFSKSQIDFAILETGLGGRLDSVTACKNRMLGFTSITMDHHDILGHSVKKIAIEKSKAINSIGQICLTVDQGPALNEVLIKQARNYNNQIKIIKNQKPFTFKYLYGDHNHQNAELAKSIVLELNNINKLNINRSAINKSIFKTKWNGRFQIIKKNPTILYDVAHNASSLKCFLESFIRFNIVNRFLTKHIIFAFEKNKKIRAVLKIYEKHFENIVCSETQIRSSMPYQDIQTIFAKKVKGNTNLENTIKETIFRASSRDCVVIIGSHYIAPILNKIFKNCFVHK